jgi:hypothetical protein
MEEQLDFDNEQDPLPPFNLETALITDLTPHPKNYRVHPEDQLLHIMESIRVNGIYRNIIVSSDSVILAGHGVVLAASKMGHTRVPIVRLPFTSTSSQAMKVLAGDNEISHLGEIDDRALSEILREIKESDPAGLLGTGYDEMMLANLVYNTRTEQEIADKDAAAQWVGMPEYEEGEDTARLKISVSFKNEDDRAEFGRLLGVQLNEKTFRMWYPPKEKDDVHSLKFEG